MHTYDSHDIAVQHWFLRIAMYGCAEQKATIIGDAVKPRTAVAVRLSQTERSGSSSCDWYGSVQIVVFHTARRGDSPFPAAWPRLAGLISSA